MRYFIAILSVSIGILSCSNPDRQPKETAVEHDHGAVPILIFQEDMELFAEADQLVVGDTVNLRAHLTFLENYSPAHLGNLSVRLVQNQPPDEWKTLDLAQAGIFTGFLIPDKTGTCFIEFKYIEDALEVSFSSAALVVYAHDQDVPEDEPIEGLFFTKEQAWKTNFGLLRIERKDFVQALHCSGEVTLASDSRIDIIAPTGGRIAYAGINLSEGRYVKQGTLLFTLLGTGTGNDNIVIELHTAQAEYEKGLADLERKEQLLKIQGVSQKEYDQAKATFQISQKRFEILSSQVNEMGMVIKSPASGHITDLRIVSNSYADKGSVLVSIIKTGGSMIKALVPVTRADKISRITSASMKLPHDSGIHSMNDWGGKLISVGRTIDPFSGMIPLFYAVNNMDLTPGLFVELWLLTDPIPEQIVVPESSLLEEYGQYYVLVQKNGETFEKRLLQIADNNGQDYLVTKGLHPGEVIVSVGALAVKVANAMGAAPVHSH